MQTVQLFQEAGADKLLRISIPVEQANRKYRLTITIEPEPTPEELGWPPGFFEQTAGAWQGEFVRDQPTEYDRRDEL